ncbi:hypothetical protein BV898_05382 [Hypsibius exemplaris]|uniref:Uncharacterized protein n=1 Tax=Hypsibius exemplaris TaxID=2072580 RepID=A0A1W0WZB8_HYPEX|nr:hypothetical protein BV898_05382 [Hypsibius exemplaris]
MSHWISGDSIPPTDPLVLHPKGRCTGPRSRLIGLQQAHRLRCPDDVWRQHSPFRLRRRSRTSPKLTTIFAVAKTQTETATKTHSLTNLLLPLACDGTASPSICGCYRGFCFKFLELLSRPHTQWCFTRKTEVRTPKGDFQTCKSHA